MWYIFALYRSIFSEFCRGLVKCPYSDIFLFLILSFFPTASPYLSDLLKSQKKICIYFICTFTYLHTYACTYLCMLHKNVFVNTSINVLSVQSYYQVSLYKCWDKNNESYHFVSFFFSISPISINLLAAC